MIKVGTDIIEVDRIRNAMENPEFSTRVFTNEEIEYCEKTKGDAKYQKYAARFAAKEAVFKAVSDLLDNKFEIAWKDIEVLNKENGKPYVVLHNDNCKDVSIDISISHIKETAIAMVVVEV